MNVVIGWDLSGYLGDVVILRMWEKNKASGFWILC